MALLRSFSDFFLRSLFPRRCLVCGGFPSASGLSADLCGGCEKDFVFLPRDGVCFVCGNPLAGGGGRDICGSCAAGRPSFSIARSVLFFSGAAARAARRFKYGADFPSGQFLFSVVRDFFPPVFGDFDAVAPVPLHPRRLRFREFNQSAFISSRLARSTGKDHVPFALRRVRDTASQASFPRRGERERNVRRAFAVRDSHRESIKGRKILLFDDIFTTGSTVNECAAALVSAGADEVGALTVFRTPV